MNCEGRMLYINCDF